MEVKCAPLSFTMRDITIMYGEARYVEQFAKLFGKDTLAEFPPDKPYLEFYLSAVGNLPGEQILRGPVYAVPAHDIARNISSVGLVAAREGLSFIAGALTTPSYALMTQIEEGHKLLREYMELGNEVALHPMTEAFIVEMKELKARTPTTTH